MIAFILIQTLIQCACLNHASLTLPKPWNMPGEPDLMMRGNVLLEKDMHAPWGSSKVPGNARSGGYEMWLV